MAVVASDRLTLATLPSPSYVRTYYLKQSSTLNPPGVPTTNPPGGNWSTTEPTFVQNETATVYTVMLTAYGTVSFEYGPVQKSASFEAAKQAYNQAISAGNSASDAYQKAIDAQNASVPKILAKTDTSKVFRDLANFTHRTTGEGAIVIRTPITASTKMCAIKITGYNFRSTRSEINLMVNFYAYTPTTPFHTPTYTSSGNFVAKVQGGVNATTGDLEIILTPPATETGWSYPDVSVPEATISFNMPPDHWADGWQISMEPLSDIAVGERYSTLVDFPMAGPQAVADDAKTKADDALAQLVNKPDKTYVDNQITLSANGKSKITTSLNAPSGTGINGDLWRRHDSSGHVYQEFTWRDGGWKPTMVTSQMVTNMDIHKLTVSGNATFTTLVADEIWSKIVRARLVVATELIAGDAIVKNTLSADRLKAKTITAESGVIDDATIDTAQIVDAAITTAKIENLSVTTAKIKEINAGKITSGYIDSARINSKTITAEKLLIGSFDNLFYDTDFELPNTYSPFSVVNKGLQRVVATGQIHTLTIPQLIPVEKNKGYTVSFFKTNVSGNAGVTVTLKILSSTGTVIDSGSYFTESEQGEFQFTVEAGNGINAQLEIKAHTGAGTVRVDGLRVQRVFDGIRLEDGVITTEKIQSGAVVSESIQADSITSEHMGANSVTAQSIGADQIMGIHIGAGTITGEHIEAESITAGNIGADSITTEKLHAGAVTYDKIELGAVRGDHLGDITKEQFMGAIDGDLSNIIDSAETIADSVIITPGEIRLTTETTTDNDGVARNYLSLPSSSTGGALYNSNYNFSASQGSLITVSITLRASKPNSRFNFDLTYRGSPLRVISNKLVPTEWTTITEAVIAQNTGNHYIDAFMFNLATGTERTAAIDIAEVRIQGAIPNGNFENGDLHWDLPTGAEIKSTGTASNATALSLTSTRQTFIVDGKDVVYIDSEEESMNIRNVVVDDSIKVGNHIIEKVSDDITAFMWAGDR